MELRSCEVQIIAQKPKYFKVQVSPTYGPRLSRSLVNSNHVKVSVNFQNNQSPRVFPSTPTKIYQQQQQGKKKKKKIGRSSGWCGEDVAQGWGETQRKTRYLSKL